ncbi:MAG: GNAT family N-acetyltransferase [Alphaproteobacteria bacterium]|nr:GNAT family N-acetyltransferase [Alphaproteobacteria bacterium]
MSIVVILHSGVLGSGREDELDTLRQVQEVSGWLRTLNYHPLALSFEEDFQTLEATLKKLKPAFVFNLVESVKGTDRLMYTATAFLDYLGILYTGCSTESLAMTASKKRSKIIMRCAGIPTADFITADDEYIEDSPVGRWIVKSDTEHSSLGMDASCVVSNLERARNLIEQKKTEYGGMWFAERYVEGREFNIALLQQDKESILVLPREILFEGYAEDMPQIVDYAAKWKEDSFSYNATPGHYEFKPEDKKLLERLEDFSRKCWDLFGLKGAARVDFRVDKQGNPWILEINANPCLSSEAGFMLVMENAGWSAPEVIRSLLPSPPELRDIDERNPLDIRTMRRKVEYGDIESIRALTETAAVFSSEEIDVARELAQEACLQGEKQSGYGFLILEESEKILGYSCYGPISLTESSFDLYWLVVDPACQRQGIAAQLLYETEQAVRVAGGTLLYAETSSTDKYAPARGFYTRSSFEICAIQPDFYRPGDGKITFVKRLL